MTRVSGFKGLSKGDLPGIDDKMEAILDALNKPIEECVGALQGGINDDNLNCETRTVEVFHSTETKVTLQKIKGSCIGAQPLWNSVFEPCSIAMDNIGENQVRIKCFFHVVPAPTDKVKVTIKFIGE